VSAGLNGLSAVETAGRIRSGEISSSELVRACLDRIEEREPVVRAWKFLDPALALAQARRGDTSEPRGPLHGVPVGLKDQFDTADRIRLPHLRGMPARGRRGDRRPAPSGGRNRAREEQAHGVHDLPPDRHHQPVRSEPYTGGILQRPPRSPTTWFRSPLGRRRSARSSARPPTAASSGTSPPSARSPAPGSSPFALRSTTSASSRER
jgi:hypothetical protein